MSNIKHTPGPWKLVFPAAYTDAKSWKATIWPESNFGAIASVNLDIDIPEWSDPQRANARLIAAAPDMLKELQAELEWQYNPNGEQSERYQRIAAIVAKATGENQ